MYKAVDEVVMEQRAHDFFTLSLSRAYRVACCNPAFHPLWIMEHDTKDHARHFRDMVKLNCVVEGRSSKEPCSYCGRNFSHQLDHFMHSCNKHAGTRELYWSAIVNIFDVNISAYLYNLHVNELTEVILGRRPDLEIFHDQWQVLLATWLNAGKCYEHTLKFN